MNDVFIVSAVRTAIGKMGGALASVQPEDLSAIVLREAIRRAGMAPEDIDEVILGQTKQSADAPNIARVAALSAGLPVQVPAYTVMRQCGSGMQAVHNGAQAIMCGLAETVLAGGVESMSNAPYYLRGARYGYKAGNAELVDSNTESQLRSQPVSLFGSFNMGITAENLAEKYKISREEQDAFAHASQKKAAEAIAKGIFKEEIVPVPVMQQKGGTVMFDTDEHPRLSSEEKLAGLKPVFREGGTVTAGNASGRNDGASALVLMSREKAARLNNKPMAVILSQACAGVDPKLMGIGPAAATRKALKLAGLDLSQIGLVELNEAFASQSLAVIKELSLNPDIINVNGGAIALGHPLGCSGARILTTLLYEMKRRNIRYGLATLCIAGGQGISTIVELV